MDCPRCGAGLITYTLEDERAAVCEACGYVGVPADLRQENDEPETWSDALQRFRDGWDRDQ